jgi:outer membrane beta-barrel protein
MKRLLCMALVLSGFCPEFAWSQDSAADDIEALFTAEEDAAEKRVEKSSDKSKDDDADGADDPSPTPPPAAKKEQADVKEMADLVKLSPFNDVAVIQKRFLPKTKRFEIYGGASGVLNNAFFMGIGGGIKMAYYFSERYGAELSYMIASTSKRQVTKDLEERRVVTSSLVTAESYMGADFKWSPIYGKMSLGQYKIVPFDMYFTAGAGMTGTNQNTSDATIHLGTGQTFAKSKAMAFRWDLSWMSWSTTTPASTGIAAGTSSNSNIVFTAGVSFFFPEATYR